VHFNVNSSEVAWPFIDIANLLLLGIGQIASASVDEQKRPSTNLTSFVINSAVGAMDDHNTKFSNVCIKQYYLFFDDSTSHFPCVSSPSVSLISHALLLVIFLVILRHERIKH